MTPPDFERQARDALGDIRLEWHTEHIYDGKTQHTFNDVTDTIAKKIEAALAAAYAKGREEERKDVLDWTRRNGLPVLVDIERGEHVGGGKP
jgi:bifunctional ADP-heptose synthase (sugar kinase/adenylyltransferase)